MLFPPPFCAAGRDLPMLAALLRHSCSSARLVSGKRNYANKLRRLFTAVRMRLSVWICRSIWSRTAFRACSARLRATSATTRVGRLRKRCAAARTASSCSTNWKKAHRDITGILLQLLGDGILTDSLGRTVSFKNTIVVMTSNLTGPQTGKPGLGFTPDCADIRAQTILREAFSPEFLGRIDCIASFRPLAAEDLLQGSLRSSCGNLPNA